MKNIALSLFSLFLFYNTVNAQTNRKRSNPKFKNNITIKTTSGFKIVDAGLYYTDSIQIAVPNNNTVALSQNVSLILILEKDTWFQKDGIVSIGASEKIVTNTGIVVFYPPHQGGVPRPGRPHPPPAPRQSPLQAPAVRRSAQPPVRAYAALSRSQSGGAVRPSWPAAARYPSTIAPRRCPP